MNELYFIISIIGFIFGLYLIERKVCYYAWNMSKVIKPAILSIILTFISGMFFIMGIIYK